MKRDDIEYVLEILGDAIDNQDWDLVTEAQEYLSDFLKEKKKHDYPDEE